MEVMFEPSEHSGQEGNLNCAVDPSNNTLTSNPELLAQKQVIRTVAVCDLGSANYYSRKLFSFEYLIFTKVII